MNRRLTASMRFLIVLGCVFASAAISRGEDAAQTEQLEFFEREVRPVLVEHCYQCHSASGKRIKAGLRLDHLSEMLRGGDSGPAIVPGDADASLIVEAVRYEGYEMPPKGKLPDDQIAALVRWVESGAVWPKDEDAPSANDDPSNPTIAEFDIDDRAENHWVWNPITRPMAPVVKDSAWPNDEIDKFILAGLENANLRPAEDIDRSVLLRRLSFDLVGLPPTADQISTFLADESPKAVERVVDALLDSPHYGERWGRHWLDLARFAESRGHEFDNDAAYAYQYRDYVIRALNADVPYDQFVREQIAGDLISPPRLNPQDGFNESILGTGFWFLGEWVHSPVDIRKDEADRLDNMIDVMSKTFLGLTVSCARCHDHKFDAISTADYYSLCGFLQSSDYREVSFESLEHNRRIAQSLSQLDTEYRQAIGRSLAQSGTQGLQPFPTPPADDSSTESNIVIDYADLQDDQWMQDGFIFGKRPRRAGEAFLTKTDDGWSLNFAEQTSAASDSFWDGLMTVAPSAVQQRGALESLPRSGRTLRTPTFTLVDGQVHCRVQGVGHVVACVDSHRMIAGPLHKETIQAIKADSTWVRLDLSRYVGHRLHLEFTPASDESLEVVRIVQGASDATRKRWDEYDAALAKYVDEFAVQVESSSESGIDDLVASWADARTQLQSQMMRSSHAAMAMMDGTGEDETILIRGNASKPGPIEPRHFLTAISGDAPMQIASGSGRLELADHITDQHNPLTARVIVNRLWHHLMGRGIVPTTDDFGVLGQRPSHPELLDYLASEFVADRQSLKRMIRRIVLTRTYQMSSRADGDAVEADPGNRLWHHRSPKRLEGEVIRDSLLAISGDMDVTMFGPSVPIHLTRFMDGRGRPKTSGPLDGDRRRSVYIEVRRNFLSPFMLAFDTPSPASAMGRRNVSNVPAQALILLNDPLVAQLTGNWAKRTMADHATTTERIEAMYIASLAREPTHPEHCIAWQFIGSQSDEHERWAELAHALVNTKEFIFVP
ncbi:DUF1553 domain-containing protein [Rubripirellula tenax]|uniref:DUF1553 domain-containing protein n=1 Tax=Rubripirellula tenax TaxID=2528015 RepID=UPI001FE70CBA|nr:PSD1 and planctomycete cytochrome C domain-containing protein [Rubripirellula tenax]